MDTLHLIHNGQFIDAINSMTGMAAKYPNENFRERLEALRYEFLMMQDYFTRGINDPRRNDIYRTLRGKLINLNYDLQVYETLRQTPMIKPWMSHVKQMDTTIDSLLQVDKDYAFYAVLTSYHWRKEDTDDWVHCYTTTSTFTASHYILLAALTMSAIEHF